MVFTDIYPGGGGATGQITTRIAGILFPPGDSAAAIVDREGLRQISDSGAMDKIVDEVLAAMPARAALTVS